MNFSTSEAYNEFFPFQPWELNLVETREHCRLSFLGCKFKKHEMGWEEKEKMKENSMTKANIWKTLYVFFFSVWSSNCLFLDIHGNSWRQSYRGSPLDNLNLIRIKQCWMVCWIDQDMFIVFMKILTIYVGGNKFKKTKTEGKEHDESKKIKQTLHVCFLSKIHNACCWIFVTILDASHNALYGSPCNNSIYFWTKQCRMSIW